MDADIFISLNHFKGHEAAGFGGALKNIGMGCGSRAGKMEMHSAGKPSVIQENCIGCSRLNPKPGKEMAKQIQDMQDLAKLLDYIGNNLPVGFEQKQKILEADTLQQRYETLMIILLNEIKKNIFCESKCG